MVEESQFGTWETYLGENDLDPSVFGKKYKCKHVNCNKSYSSSQSRSRHYRNDHSADRIRASVSSSYHVASNRESDLVSSESDSNESSERAGLKDAISLTHIILNSYDTDAAVAQIKCNSLVQEYAIEMSNHFESLLMTNFRESNKNKNALNEVTEGLFSQTHLSHSLGQYAGFRAVLDKVFEADNTTIPFLRTFAQILTMSVSHMERYSENVNAKHKQARLMKRVLSEIIEESETSSQESYSVEQVRKRHQVNPGQSSGSSSAAAATQRSRGTI